MAGPTGSRWTSPSPAVPSPCSSSVSQQGHSCYPPHARGFMVLSHRPMSEGLVCFTKAETEVQGGPPARELGPTRPGLWERRLTPALLPGEQCWCGRGEVPGGQGYRPGWDSRIGTLLPEPPAPFWLVPEHEPLILPNPLLGWNIP